MKRFMILLTALTMTLWAQSQIVYVGGEESLREVISGAYDDIRLSSDIALTECITVPAGKDIVINLHGHNLSRTLITTATANGHVVSVASGATLTIIDSEGGGIITGGHAINGGAISNSGVLNVTGVTFTGNLAGTDGGAIWNEGTLVMTNCTVNGNRAEGGGAGIWSKGTATLSGVEVSDNNGATNGGGLTNHGTMTIENCQLTENRATSLGGAIYNGQLPDNGPATFIMKGANTVSNNSATGNGSGIYTYQALLKVSGTPVVSNNFTDDIYLPAGNVITLDGELAQGARLTVKPETYGVKIAEGYNQAESPEQFFYATDHATFTLTGTDVYETFLGYSFIERSWSELTHEVSQTKKNIIASSSVHVLSSMESGDDCTLTMQGDDAWYVADKDVTFESIEIAEGTDANLILCDKAQLRVLNGVHAPSGTRLTIYGQKDDTGRLTVTVDDSDDNNAAIGGHNDEGSGTIVIHGGNVTARCGDGSDAAAIGGGDAGSCGDLIIYGGTVTASGSTNGAGIGGGRIRGVWRDNKICIYGGIVAASSAEGAGIGTGNYDEHYTFIDETNDTNPGPIYIYGGTVRAWSTGYGCGIGGGKMAAPGVMSISGGKVEAWVEAQHVQLYYQNVAIGGGSIYDGTLTLADNMRFYAGDNADNLAANVNKENREQIRRQKAYAMVQQCNHDYCTLMCDEHGMATADCNYCNSYAATQTPHTIDHYEGFYGNLRLTGRTLYRNGAWNTITLPFDLTISGSPLNGADVRTLSTSDFDDATGELSLNFTAEGTVTTMQAGTPYIIRWEKADDYVDNEAHNLTRPLFSQVTIKSASANVSTSKADMIGTYAATTIYQPNNKTNLYLGADNTICFPTATNFAVDAFRAYFQLKDGLSAGNPETAQPSGVRILKLYFGDDDMTLGITSAKPLLSAPTDDNWFTLDGRQLQGRPTKSGIYLNNGRKVVIN